MNKLIFLTIIFGCFATYDTLDVTSNFMDDIQELDQIYLTAAMDVNNPEKLPSTPRAIYESWCRPMMSRTATIMDLVDGLFKDNTIFLILYRIIEMTKLNIMSKLCESDPSIMRIVADYNKLFNKFLYRYIPWYEMSVNTYLSAADPNSEVDAGYLICQIKKMMRRILAVKAPPLIKKGLSENLANYKQQNFQLAKDILDYMKVDFNVKACQLENRPHPNQLGIKSIDVAALLAWNKVTKNFT